MGPSPLARRRVVVLPDLFVDAIVHLPSWPEAQAQWAPVVARGGGNVPVGPIEFKLGGNAANVALALARLGAGVDLVARTSGLGLSLLEPAAREANLRIRHVRPSGHPSATLALECGGANLMLSHAGPLARFGPEELTAAEWRTILAADAVVATNWAQNPAGTKLLRAVAERVGARGIPLFVDTSDPRLAAERIPGLLAESRIWRHVRSFGLNENELRAFTGDRAAPLPELADELAARLGCPLDVHTREWAAHVDGGRQVVVPARTSKPRRLTGAGDAWNAGNIAGYLAGLEPAQRLRLAHAVATAYVRSPDGRPPRHGDLPDRLWGRPQRHRLGRARAAPRAAPARGATGLGRRALGVPMAA